MLYPKIELMKKSTFCSCGQTNFRCSHDTLTVIKKVYKIALPTPPLGGEVYYLCEDCIKKITESVEL